MKGYRGKPAAPWVVGILCGLLSFAIVYLFVPAFFMQGIPDLIWILLRLLLPAVAGVVLLETGGRCAAGYVWLGLPVQYTLLVAFAAPLSRYLGVSVEHTLLGSGWADYIGSQFLWPLAVTLLQFFVLRCGRKGKR